MAQRTVILVDEDNTPIGTEDIIAAHTGQGKLHRAFSAYVFRKAGKEILIQKRSNRKMLWPGIWANTCCSHPFEGEEVSQAGARRLQEELGFTCNLLPVCSFIYRAEDPGHRGVEHEHVTVLLGLVDDTVQPQPNAEEVSDWQWVVVEHLRSDMRKDPAKYAPWFHLGMNAIRESA